MFSCKFVKNFPIIDFSSEHVDLTQGGFVTLGLPCLHFLVVIWNPFLLEHFKARQQTVNVNEFEWKHTTDQKLDFDSPDPQFSSIFFIAVLEDPFLLVADLHQHLVAKSTLRPTLDIMLWFLNLFHIRNIYQGANLLNFNF